MKEKTFKPILAPNEQPNLEELNYPLMASYKLDGIRCIFYKGQILSRSLKQIQNKQLREKFEPIRKYSEENDLILDGEIYSQELTFQEITSFVMTQDFEDKKSIKKFGKVMEIPDHLKYYCFDCLDKFTGVNNPFKKRITACYAVQENITDVMEVVKHISIISDEFVTNLFENALEDGYEGLILRDPNGLYKFGRGTLKEGIIYKVKPYKTFDAVITGVVQSTIVDPNAEKKTNELGRSVTSKKKDDRILIEKASAFNVDYKRGCLDCDGEGANCNGEHGDCTSCKGTGILTYSLKVVLAMTDEEKEEMWKNRESYIGRWIQYKGMLVGAKDVPRHPVMERFREDKDD